MRGFVEGFRFALQHGDDEWQAGYDAGYRDGQGEYRSQARSFARRARDAGRRSARRETVEVLTALAPKVADQTALAWLDGLHDAGFDLEAYGLDVAGLAQRLREWAELSFMAEAGSSLMERENVPETAGRTGTP